MVQPIRSLDVTVLHLLLITKARLHRCLSVVGSCAPTCLYEDLVKRDKKNYYSTTTILNRITIVVALKYCGYMGSWASSNIADGQRSLCTCQ